MFQSAIQYNLQNTLNFIGYMISYLKRNNPVVVLTNMFAEIIKNYLTMGKKLKMAKYRVNYQMYKLEQMEKLIAENNEHVFLYGNKFNTTR